MREIVEDEPERLPVNLGKEQSRHLANIRDIAIKLSEIIESSVSSQDIPNHILHQLDKIRKQADELSRYDKLIYWLEVSEDTEHETTLYAIPKDLDERLLSDQWDRNIPIILTSGTLSTNGDFTHSKRILGLSTTKRLSETSKPSPFNHWDNSRLYISENVPYPNPSDPDYILSLTNEIERLIRAAHGHTAVLFTSHNVMGKVFSKLEKRNLSYPLYKLGRGDLNAIEKFRHSGNGVLFAAGSMWEGVDIPGDTLSLLIIVKLPFPVPDPILDYERTQYGDQETFLMKVIIPEMLIKLKQGFGRLLRKETDTGVIAILDSRVRVTGTFRKAVIKALPTTANSVENGLRQSGGGKARTAFSAELATIDETDLKQICYIRITNRITDIISFLRAKKDPKYFESRG